MSLIAKGFEPDINVLKGKLLHWFSIRHIRPEQGIALLIGLDPDDKCIEAIVDWGKDKYNDDCFLGWGASLLDGGEISLHPHPDEVSDRECIHQFERDHFTELARTRFAVFVLKYSQLHQCWDSDHHPKPTPLSHFVEWARLNGFSPYWKYVAIELEKISEESSVNDNEPPVNQSNLNSDREHLLLKHIGALALVLAEKSKLYKCGDKPNALQIAIKAEELLKDLPDANSYGVGKSKIRESVSAGLDLLTTIKIKK